MEKLILEIATGDDYTWSAIITLPIMYSSKKDAINDLQEIMLNYLIRLEDGTKKVSKLRDDQALILKKKKENVSDDDVKRIFELNKSCVDLEVNYIGKKFNFGGQELEYSDFIYSSGNERQIVMPEIKTIDEFFQPVLTNNKKNKIT